ncbi:hypothetical protein DFP74_5695 [Nocardiopsis sp. Huas11]|uniref:hypothetical protein n=1 Tax=Nocardiopsis sp. Huas11 TaxID=2183912 RepID=UPI000EB17CF9|nr:hypothetical protein [Nocardiopsis sp. Huas11]RKS09950.1 hypothetical protein DFP74_5695 [Nocardiopsis sp. Huas11]
MEQWATKEEIIAARERMEASHPGWERPAAFAVGVVRDGETSFGLTNAGGNYFPAIVLARAVGHASGTATYPLSRGQLETAVAELSPAEACTEFRHPNLVHWRELLDEVADRGGQFVAVFVGDLDDPPVDEHDRALRAAVSN